MVKLNSAGTNTPDIPTLSDPNSFSRKLGRVSGATVFMGLDPGAHGGVAYIYNEGVEVYKTPDSRRELLDSVRSMTFGLNCFACVERVGGFIGGDRGSGKQNLASGHTMFKFGQSYERLLMVLTVLEIPHEEVLPQAWQKALGITPKRKGERKRHKESAVSTTAISGKETQSQFKRRLANHAQALFPQVKVTLQIADALLLAEFCKRKFTGTL